MSQTETMLASLLEEILHAPLPADRVLAAFLRRHPQIGAQSRRHLSHAIHLFLRHRRLLAALKGSEEAAIAHLAHLSSEDDAPWGSMDLTTLPAPVRHSLPDWLWERCAAHLGDGEAHDLFQALNLPAPLDLRVNTLKNDRQTAAKRLADEGIESQPTPHSPWGLRLSRRIPLQGTAVFKEGRVEIQDQGSQGIAPLLSPRPGEVIIDLCAGGGGKSLHLAALMANKGKIIAADTDHDRLSQLKPRLRRAGARIIQPLPIRHERDRALSPFIARAHGVLVDAPCSGTGTLRRNPGLKWTITPELVTTLAERQASLLAAAAELTAPGGRLLYVTCSILPQENQAVAAAFSASDRRFTPVSLDVLPHGLFSAPHSHGSDAFFAALWVRKR